MQRPLESAPLRVTAIEASPPIVGRSPVQFLLLTAGLSVPFWVLGSVIRTPQGSPVALPLSALQVFAPALAAGALVLRDGGASGVRRFVADAFTRRGLRGWRRVGTVVLLMPAIYGSAYLIMRLAGQPMPDPVIVWSSVPLLIGIFLVTAFLEEIGWTGYALSPLQARWGAVGAALILGVVWAGVHVIPDLQGGHDVGWIAAHRSSSIAIRFLIVWAYNANGSSVPAAVIVHAMDNVSWVLFPNEGSHYNPAFVAPITALVAAYLVLRGRLEPTSSH